MLCGFDDDVLRKIVATIIRIRGLLTQIHPALERVLGPQLDHPAVLDLLQKYPSPASMKTAGTVQLGNRLITRAPRMGRHLAAEITQAPREQTKEFAIAGHLASYAGLAPVTRRSGSSIRGEHNSRRGNKALKTGTISLCFCGPPLFSITDLLRPKDNRGQKTQAGPARPRQMTLQRPLRHDARRHPLRERTPKARPCRSTKT